MIFYHGGCFRNQHDNKVTLARRGGTRLKSPELGGEDGGLKFKTSVACTGAGNAARLLETVSEQTTNETHKKSRLFSIYFLLYIYLGTFANVTPFLLLSAVAS